MQLFPITILEVRRMIDNYVTRGFQAQMCTIFATRQQKSISVNSWLYNIWLATFDKSNACKHFNEYQVNANV